MRHVALSVVLLVGLAIPSAADVRARADQSRRPVGPRVASSLGVLTQGSDSGLCAVNGNGTVRCWGSDTRITLSDATVPFSDPVVIPGVTSAVAISVGANHACALRSDGKVLCWGSNTSKQLGREASFEGTHPAQEVPTLTNVVSLAAGAFFNCVVKINSNVLCWGDSASAQLGQVFQQDVVTPAVIPNFSAVAVTAGIHFACALRSNGTAACWGHNDFRQADPGSNAPDITEPVALPLETVVDINAGFEHACAVLASGAARCWGRNLEEQLGPGATNADGFREVEGVTNIVTIDAGFRHTCALIADGSLRCWGNPDGITGGSGPVFQPAITGAIDIAVSRNTCAATGTGLLRCFAGGATATIFNESDPAPDRARGIAAGALHSCARRADGTFMCWGENGFGQLGKGYPADQSSPGQVMDDRFVGTIIAAGGAHSCARTTTGRALCWGDDSFGQIGDADAGGVRTVPVNVIDQGTTALTNIIAVTNGGSHSCALLASGRAKCWGSNVHGQLGDGTDDDAQLPVFVRASTVILENIKSISAGSRHTCALLADGTARCWGANEAGQVNPQDSRDVLTAFTSPGGSNLVAIAAGGQHSCTVSQTGVVRCWGRNSSGQLGPVSSGTVHSFSGDAVGAAAGDSHSCAVRADGTIQCWGENSSRQLGNEGTADSATPVLVKERRVVSCSLQPAGVCSIAFTLTSMVSLDAGDAHTCAIRGDGQPFCWGADNSGQIGNGPPNTNESSAKAVDSF